MLTDKPLQVVVVEDSEAFLLRLRAALSDLPVKVVGSAANSSDAIAVIDRTQPDLVLLDVFLENSSGVDVLRHLEKTASKARTLVMTSEQADGLRLACVALGAHRFLDKAGLILALEDEVLALLKHRADIRGSANGFEVV
jgi:two-component system nitrate/nitrite response regulator NarP